MVTASLILILVGLLGGILAGLTGLGGGIIFVIILPFALTAYGIPLESQPKFIIACSLFAITASSIAANVQLWRLGKFRLKPILAIAATTILVSIATIRLIVEQPWFSAEVFHIILLIMLTLTLARTMLYQEHQDNLQDVAAIPLLDLSLVGILTGLIQPLSGLGGGIIMIPVLNTVYKISLKEAGALSLGVIGLTSLVNVFTMATQTVALPDHLAHSGYLIWPVALPLTVGVMVGSPLGITISQKLQPKTIRLLFGLLMGIAIARKLMEVYAVL